MKIAYQGEPGAFSEAAGRRLAPDAELLPCRSFEDVFASVRDGRPSYGIVPIENSIGGSIHRNYDLLRRARAADRRPRSSCRSSTSCWRCPARRIERLRRVYSHPQALAQCERFLRTLNGVEIIATYDTAGSAKMVADEQPRGRRGDRVGPGRRGVRPDGARLVDSGLRRQHHALPRHRPPAASRRACPTRLDRLLAAERAGLAVQGAERVRAARHRSDEARVAADSRPALGIPVLRRPGRGARRGDVRAARWRISPSSPRCCARSARTRAGRRTRAGCPIPSRWSHDRSRPIR